MNILISPYSNELKERRNAKNYPHWRELVGLLRLHGHKVYQIGLPHEQPIGSDGFLTNYKLNNIKDLLTKFDMFMSVDNFFPHYVNLYRKDMKGFVIFSRSDPKIYGYRQNFNILKDERYLRPDQWGLWKDCEFLEESFYTASEILPQILDKIGSKTAISA